MLGPMSDDVLIFDRHAVRLHRERAARHGITSVAGVLDELAGRLLDRLDDVTRPFSHALDIGGRGRIAPLLRARGIHTVSCDLSPSMASLSGTPCVAADEEWLPFAPASFDLIVASMSLHWINDLPGALVQIRQALKPDGLFLASMPVFGTLDTLREALSRSEDSLTGGASPRVAPFATLQDGAALLQRAGFALPVADQDEVTLLYKTPMALLHDLRAAGETNAVRLRDRSIPPFSLFPLALSHLTQEGQPHMQARLRLAMLTGWGPADSQPKPARRGSGQISLADILGTPPIEPG
ncbi:Biotin synthesis protein bioC [Granulibacter bethesdensis]|uniref:Biotin synthesis protein bioC n=2 Tax=Granulibacter bethesdensis TaxID=364410 RepID=A0AAN0RCI1_9PROT|nr:Biotin synthesis protein bioC [Granulibacter bethesdensis]